MSTTLAPLILSTAFAGKPLVATADVPLLFHAGNWPDQVVAEAGAEVVLGFDPQSGAGEDYLGPSAGRPVFVQRTIGLIDDIFAGIITAPEFMSFSYNDLGAAVAAALAARKVFAFWGLSKRFYQPLTPKPEDWPYGPLASVLPVNPADTGLVRDPASYAGGDYFAVITCAGFNYDGVLGAFAVDTLATEIAAVQEMVPRLNRFAALLLSFHDPLDPDPDELDLLTAHAEELAALGVTYQSINIAPADVTVDDLLAVIVPAAQAFFAG